MKQIKTGDENRLAYREPVGWWVLIAAPFLLGMTALGGVMWSLQLPMLNEGIGAAIFGLFFVVWVIMGIRMTVHWFGRIGVDLDRRGRTVTTTWGLFFPFVPTDARLDDFVTVVLDNQTRGSGRDRVTEIVVRLTGPKQSVCVARGQAYAPLRSVAEDIARFLSFPLLDVRGAQPEWIDLEVYQRPDNADLHFDADKLPPQPELRRLRAELLGDELTFHIPLFGVGCFVVWCLLVLAAAAGVTAIGYYNEWNPIPMGMFGGIFSFVLLVLYSALSPSREIVIATPDWFVLKTQGFVLSSRRRIPWNEVKELTLGPHTIALLSRSQSYAFGNVNLTPTELAWIHASLMYYWRGSQPTQSGD